MPTTEKKITVEKRPVRTIRELLVVSFKLDEPKDYANMLIDSWLCVLANLDHTEQNHFGPSDIQVLSEFFLDFKQFCTDGHAALQNIQIEE